MTPADAEQSTVLDFCQIISARSGGHRLHDYLEINADAINQQLVRKGAVVLRNFKPVSVEELSDCIALLGGKEVFYRGGLGPRTKVGKGVYTASDIGNIFPIKLHQEMSYQEHFPDTVVFYCEQPAPVRGETPLANVRKVTAEMPAHTKAKFRDLGVRYVSVFHDKNRKLRERVKALIPLHLHLTWQDAFASDDRDAVAAECARRDLSVKWRDNGDLETTAILPAFRIHPATGEELWFNSVISLHFNPRTLVSDFGNLIYYMRKALYHNRRNLPNQVYFGDGSAIDYGELLPIYEAYDRNTYPHAWRRGDLMVLDNRLVAHGRNSFRGKRVVFASMLGDRFVEAMRGGQQTTKRQFTKEISYEKNGVVVT